MPKAVVVLNTAGVKALLNSPEIRGELQRRAEAVEAEAKESAPLESGEHRDSIHIEHATTDRAVVRVVADSDHSLWVEARTGHLARSLKAAHDA